MTTDWIQELLAVFIILAAGASVFYLVVRTPERYGRLERWAYCYPLGLVALGIPMFLMSWAGYHPNVPAIGGMTLGALVVFRLARKTPLARFWLMRGERETGAPGFTEAEWLLMMIIVACLGMRLITSMLAPLNDNDGIAEWGLKARILYHDTLRHTDYFQRADLSFSNHSYPLLWPFMYAWVCTCIGRWDDLGMLILNPLNLIAFAILLYYACCRYASRTVALATTACMVSLPALLHYTECGQADVPLMLMAGVCFFCLFDWIHTRSTESLVLSGILMAGCLFTKHQGMVVLGAYGAAAMASVYGTKTRKLLGQLAGVSLLVFILILPWIIFSRRIINYSAETSHVSPATIRWHDLPAALGFIAAGSVEWYNSVKLAKWNLLWPVIALAACCSKCTRQRPWCYIVLVWGLQSAVILLLYLAKREPIGLGLGTEFGLEREALVILAPLWLLLAKCVDEQWRIWKGIL
ncbi:MAG: ArnT family glycosyltransferase [Verrucomicrobiia bacterium]